MKHPLMQMALVGALSLLPAASGFAAQELPPILHFCLAHCATLELQGGRYVWTSPASWLGPGFMSVWTVESFSQDSVALTRRDFPIPLGGTQLKIEFSGRMSADHNQLVDGAVNGKPAPNLRLSWGTALDATPGSDDERSNPSRVAASRLAPPPTPPESVRPPSALGMEFVKVPAGKFLMGCELGPECGNDNVPVHAVTLAHDFWIATTKVTQGQWKTVMGSNPSFHQRSDRHPVENVTWDQVQQFIRTLNEREGCQCYRLPTEAEWEYMARLDAPTWRNAFFMNAQAGGGEPTRVGSLPPGRLGLFDVFGNVWEMTADLYGGSYSYTADAQIDPLGPRPGTVGANRVVRGGSYTLGYYSDFYYSARFYVGQTGRDSFTGFRLLRTGP